MREYMQSLAHNKLLINVRFLFERMYKLHSLWQRLGAHIHSSSAFIWLSLDTLYPILFV